MAEYSLTAAAQADLDRLYVYGLLNFGIDRADRYSKGLIEHLDYLAESPAMYPAIEHVRRGYRRSVYGVHSVLFRVASERVEIIRILGSEDIESAI